MFPGKAKKDRTVNSPPGSCPCMMPATEVKNASPSRELNIGQYVFTTKKKKSGKGKQQSTYTEQQRKCGMYKISHRDRSGIRLQECVNCNRSGPESLCGNMMWGDFGYHQGGYFESFVNEARGGPRTTSQGFCSCRGHSRSDWELARCSSEVERTNR